MDIVTVVQYGLGLSYSRHVSCLCDRRQQCDSKRKCLHLCVCFTHGHSSMQRKRGVVRSQERSAVTMDVAGGVDVNHACLATCQRLYEEYRWLLDCCIADFFVGNYWGMLLPSWKDFFENNEPDIMAEILSYDHGSSKAIYPLSMLAVRQLLRSNTLPRKQAGERESRSSERRPWCANIFTHSAVNRLFWKHVKQKKVHEISQLGRKCAEVARNLQADIIVDCGSGLGHLARFLAYKFKLRVICVEAQEKLSRRAMQLDEEFERRVAKCDESLLRACRRPAHLNHKLRCDMSHAELLALISDSREPAPQRIGLVGLHPCGDLAAVLLRLFKECERVAFVCTVGCCYMKLTDIGHPLSCSALGLSYEARELACHAIEKLARQIREEGAEHLRTHAWRATLEEMLVSRWPHMRHAPLRSGKYSQHTSFGDYCSNALEGSGVQLGELCEDLHSERVSRMLRQADRVVTFNCLRAMFAPLLETMLLLDRRLYVCETAGVTATLEAVFDPCVSARNHLLTAHRWGPGSTETSSDTVTLNDNKL